MTKRVLILCTGNSCRSQMAEGLFRNETRGAWEVQSAGSDPAGCVDPLAVQVLAEVGIDIGSHQSKHVDQFRDHHFDLVVTVCDAAAQDCPVFHNAQQTLHWPFEDPGNIDGSDDERITAFRKTREQITARIRDYLSENSAGPAQNTDEFLDRDMSWLEFNRRVLHEATDQRTPLLERLLFLGIFTSNLDEFFMKRGNRVASDPVRLAEVRRRVGEMLKQQSRCFQTEIRPALRDHGIHLLGWEELSDDQKQEAKEYFRRNVFPVMTPQAVDPSHPFPFISNLSDSLAITFRYPDDERRLFARTKIPSQLPQWIQLSNLRNNGSRYFASLREIVHHHLSDLFPGMVIDEALPIRVTRGAEVDVEHVEAEDLLEQVEEELRQRRLQDVVRLEHAANPDSWLLEQVVRPLQVGPEQVYEMPGELDYTDFLEITGLPIKELRYPSWTPVIPQAFESNDTDIFATIRQADVLVHHPYESFDASVARFVRSAVDDKNVLAIRLTLYRTSDDTPFVPWLIEAAEAGKQVVCLVELKARFDEHRNIRWANALEDAGIHVVYGVIGKKTHTKTALVVRREKDGLRSYAHIGTGNYHPKTARLYVDLGLFTADPEITEDVVELFNYLTGRSLKDDYHKLLVAPVTMKQRFIEMIGREAEHHRAGQPAHIIAKMNQLEDHDVCRALYQASQAGVPIDLIIRGFCVLRPGVPGLSPTIRVTSVIGRFLEHSRIYYFRNGAASENDGQFFIGSADWMHRNLEERIEAITPIESAPLRSRLWSILQVLLDDRRQAWDMDADGGYRQRSPHPEDSDDRGSHQVLMDFARRSVNH